MSRKNTLEVSTPAGTLIAYASMDPQNPGIFIDLKRDDVDFQLNLAGTECLISEDNESECRLVSHVWGDGIQEDTTYDITHDHIDEYFDSES